MGLYRYIRHPQYVALGIIGFGTSLYWSRFIVVIAFVSMLCVYYLLARVEEGVCLAKFGRSYRDYMQRTGMFVPRSWERRWRRVGIRLPRTGLLRYTVIFTLIAGVLGLTIVSAQTLRAHVIDSLQIDDGSERVTVFLAPVDTETRQDVARLLSDPELPGSLAYVAPASWHIPELGLTGTEQNHHPGGLEELLHPTTHGNPLVFDQDRLTVLLAQASGLTANKQGIARLAQALSIHPLEIVDLDVTAGHIVDRRPAGSGVWAGIPVPTF